MTWREPWGGKEDRSFSRGTERLPLGLFRHPMNCARGLILQLRVGCRCYGTLEQTLLIGEQKATMVDLWTFALLVQHQAGKSIDRGSAVTPLEMVQRTEKLSSQRL
jgi:hypothetical protein